MTPDAIKSKIIDFKDRLSFTLGFEQPAFVQSSVVFSGLLILFMLMSSFSGSGGTQNTVLDSTVLALSEAEEPFSGSNTPAPLSETTTSISSTYQDIYYTKNGKQRPIMARDGATVYETFRQNVNVPANMPMISLVFIDQGLDANTLSTLINSVPEKSGLALSPYNYKLSQLADMAQKKGHEAWLLFPGRSRLHPFHDRGPLTFKEKLSVDKRLALMEAMVSSAPYIIGLAGHIDDVSLSSEEEKEFLRNFLHGAGLGFISGKQNADISYFSESIPAGTADLLLNDDPSPSTVLSNLKELEAIAKKTGTAVGYAYLYETDIKEITEWAKGLEAKGIAFVPPSNITEGTFAPYNHWHSSVSGV